MATASLVGLDPGPLLEARDPAEFKIWEAVVNRADKMRDQANKRLASQIAEQVGKLFPK